jgi:glutaconate CoA-transferase subunit B
MRFDVKTQDMYLSEYYLGVSPQQIQENTGFEIDISGAVASKPVTEEELRVLREEIDPQRLII